MIRRLVIRWFGVLLPLMAAGRLFASDAGDRWWEAFDHSGLSAVIEQGLNANADPVAAAARLRAARQQVSAVASAGRPVARLDAAYRLGREKSMMTGDMEDTIDPLAGSAHLSWELDLFRRVSQSVDAASARVDVRQADLAALRLSLSINIARTYIDLAFRDEEVALLQASANDANATLRRAIRRVEAGLDNPVAAEEARAMYQQAEHLLLEAEITREQRMAAFRELLGGEDPVMLPGPLVTFRLPAPPDLSGADLYLGRPDVARAFHLWQAAQGDATAAARSRLPSLSIVVAAAGEGKDAGDPRQWEAWAGPVLSVPLWEPRRSAETRVTLAGVSAAEADFLSVSRRAVREIDAAWTARQHAERMAAHMEERYRALAEAAASAGRRRDAGLIQASDLNSARITMREASIARHRWFAAGLHSHLTLVGALGGIAPVDAITIERTPHPIHETIVGRGR